MQLAHLGTITAVVTVLLQGIASPAAAQSGSDIAFFRS